MRLECLFWTVLGLICTAEAGMIGDQCDWTGSGLSSNTERAVTPVYLRCGEGAVRWRYPRGALRLLFRPPLPPQQREFRVCVRVIRRPDPPDLFHTLRLNDTAEVAERFPARIFVEGPRRLVPLYAPDDDDPRELRCFRSRRGAALYVEAEPEEGPKRRVAAFRYEARPLDTRSRDPNTADCRPCTDSEMELAFCTSDLVSRGIFIGSEQREELAATQLTVRVTGLIRATAATAATGDQRADVIDDEHYYRYETDNALGEGSEASAGEGTGEESGLLAHVHVPAACGAAAGAGEFLVMARRRLGRYALVCAPRADHWQRLARRRTEEGTAHCTLLH